MKKITQIIIAFFLIVCLNYDDQNIQAQNLVLNPSFEDTLFCPLYLTQLYATSNWLNFGISPDYYNSCNNTGVSVPNAVFGYQYAHSGNGMAGMFLKRKPNSPDGINAKEFIASELTSNLNIGSKYFFSCYINFSYLQISAVACNKFGMKLSTISYDSSQFLTLINNFAHVYTDSIVSDSVQWFKVSGSFIADSNYTYIILGNFFEDQFIDTICIGTFPDYSYYYLDDVCLSLDSNYCENWTSVKSEINNNLNPINVFPIPTLDFISISCEYPIISLKLYDVHGNLHHSQIDLFSNNFKLDISVFPKGVYFLNIQTTKSMINKTIVKI